MNKLIPFNDRLRQILYDKDISTYRFEIETGISRRFFYRYNHKINRSTLMGIAYYLDMRVEDLVDGTTAMDALYR